MLGKDKVLCKTNSVQNKHKHFLQTDLPFHTRSCKKSDDIWSSNNISSRPNFQSFQPCSKGDPTAGFGICAFNHIFVLYEDLRTCCLNVSSLGGNLTKVESSTVSNFTRNLFSSIWHRFDLPFGSYSLDISFRLRSTESFYSRQITKLIGWLFQRFGHRVLPDTKEQSTPS